ncbi:hypothetical protein [Brevibacterium litoralis]|uniref:hypothetical protein n=1 Tax=Brevibacterium litoralis TaxID=3138935 RepID=UPI0032EBF37B
MQRSVPNPLPRPGLSLLRATTLPVLVATLLLAVVLTGLGLPARATPAPTDTPSSPAPEAPATAGADVQGASAADSAEAGTGEADSPVLVLGASGLRWTDIDPELTPHLWGLAESGALGNLTVRTLTSTTCPTSGWLTLGAGKRARDPRPGGLSVCPDATGPADLRTGPLGTDDDPAGLSTDPLPAPPAADTDAEVLPGFSLLERVNASGGYSTRLGVLGDAVAESGQCLRTIGGGAGYAGVRSDGTVADWAPAGAPVVPEDATDPCGVTLVDLGTIAVPRFSDDTVLASDRETFDDAAYRAQVAAVDAHVGEYLAQIDPADTTVFVVGVGDTTNPSRLRTVLRAGPGVEPGYLGSTTTRRDDLVQLTDLTGTIVRAAGIDTMPGGAAVDPTVTTGTSAGVEERVARLQAEYTSAATVHKSASTFGVVLDVFFYLLVLAAAALFHRGVRVRLDGVLGDGGSVPRWRRVVGGIGLGAATVPMGAFLVALLPWSRFPVPELGLGLGIGLASLALLGVAFLGPWRRTWSGRVAAICVTTALALAVDNATGSRLQYDTLMGYNAIVAGRFYGLGNQGVALFMVAVFLGLGLVVARLRGAGRARLALGLTVLVGLASVVVLGNPAWGAKFGGTIAVIAGFLVFAALQLGIRLNILKLAGIGLVSLTVVLGIAGLDHLRPEAQQSHFGRFFGQILSGELFTVIERKLAANLNIVSINPALAIVVPLAVLLVVVFLSYGRWRREGPLREMPVLRDWQGPLPRLFRESDPALHWGFLAAVTALGVGLVITDSGVAVPATGAFMLVPLLLALCADQPGWDPVERTSGPDSDDDSEADAAETQAEPRLLSA